MSIIIIEGLERCNKTSTVNFIRSKIQNPLLIVHHSAKPPKGLTRQQMQTWAAIHYTELFKTFDTLSSRGYDIIMDRAHIGEYVYGHMYRGNSTEDDYMFFPETLIDLSSVYLILLTDSPKNVLSREDGQSLSTTEEKIDTERKRFIEGTAKSKVLNKLHVDWESYFPGETFEVKQKYFFDRVQTFLGL